MIRASLLIVALVAQQRGAQPPARPGTPGRATISAATADTATLLKYIADSERRFLDAWSAAWHISDQPRTIGHGTVKDIRQADVSCSSDPGMYIPDFALGVDPRRRRIESANAPLAVCPNWFLSPGSFPSPPKVRDERLDMDGGLTDEVRPAARAARARLIALLDTAAQRMPANNDIVGQRIRLLVDQGDLKRALDVARDCKAYDWWCNALSGFVHARAGLPDAEAFFHAAEQGLVDEDRCKWTDVSGLLDSAGRAAYTKMTCTQRDQFNTRFWWLADPLWSEPGNDRYVEQSVRSVLTFLHGTTVRDERFTWAPQNGGDAVEQTIKRYGWPTYLHAGQSVAAGMPPESQGMKHLRGVNDALTPGDAMLEKIRQDWLLCEYDNRHQVIPGSCMGMDIGPMLMPERYGPGGNTMGRATSGSWDTTKAPSVQATLDYSMGRVHLVPQWSALDNPLKARNTDWDLNAPREPGTDLLWWPQEHYAPPHPLVQLADQQFAFLRRQTEPLLAFATNLGEADLRRRPRDSVQATLVASSGPGAIALVARKRVGAASRLVFLESVGARAIVVGVEVAAGRDSESAARTRFGVEPPRPLELMTTDERAISQPILLAAPLSVDALPNDADGAVPLMLGSTTLPEGTLRFGVYWETYGFTAADTLDITLRVQRTTPLSPLQRAGVATGLAGNPDAPVRVSWREPDAGHRVRTVSGPVPIQMRSIVLDISTLSPGEWVLEVSAGTPGATPVRSTREFTVR